MPREVDGSEVLTITESVFLPLGLGAFEGAEDISLRLLKELEEELEERLGCDRPGIDCGGEWVVETWSIGPSGKKEGTIIGVVTGEGYRADSKGDDMPAGRSMGLSVGYHKLVCYQPLLSRDVSTATIVFSKMVTWRGPLY